MYKRQKQDLLRRPNQSITLNITRGFNDALFGLSILASGQRKDFGVTLPGYAIVNVMAQYKLSDKLSINTQIENLFDKKYETAANYNMQGSSVFFDINYSW